MDTVELTIIVIEIAILSLTVHRARYAYVRAHEYIDVKAFKHGDMMLKDSYSYSLLSLMMFVLMVVQVVEMI